MESINLKEYVEKNNKDLTEILEAVKTSSIEILNLLRNLNSSDKNINTSKNSSGDIQNKIDILSHNIFVDNILETKKVTIIISEECDHPVHYNYTDSEKLFSFVVDPLDGSSNIDCNVPTGTIFGIYENKKNDLSDVLREGKNLICSGYILYSAAVEMVITLQKKVVLFSYDETRKDFFVKIPNLKFPEEEKNIFSVNIGNCDFWDEETKDLFFNLIEENYSSRYVGSMVADIHRTLLYGGIFSYPSDKRNKNGKLRLLYECNPVALIVKHAGGFSTNGEIDILDMKIENIHQKTSFFSGSPKIMKDLFY